MQSRVLYWDACTFSVHRVHASGVFLVLHAEHSWPIYCIMNDFPGLVQDSDVSDGLPFPLPVGSC